MDWTTAKCRESCTSAGSHLCPYLLAPWEAQSCLLQPCRNSVGCDLCVQVSGCSVPQVMDNFLLKLHLFLGKAQINFLECWHYVLHPLRVTIVLMQPRDANSSWISNVLSLPREGSSSLRLFILSPAFSSNAESPGRGSKVSYQQAHGASSPSANQNPERYTALSYLKCRNPKKTKIPKV